MSVGIVPTLEHLFILPVPPGDQGQVTKEKIVDAVAAIVAAINPVRVVAFGSRVRGDHEAQSDLDLAVIVDHYNPQTDDRPIWRSQIPVLMPIDLAVYDLDRERLMSHYKNSLQWVIAREGKVLYERHEGSVRNGVVASLV